jgi:hypothetical protein
MRVLAGLHWMPKQCNTVSFHHMLLQQAGALNTCLCAKVAADWLFQCVKAMQYNHSTPKAEF